MDGRSCKAHKCLAACLNSADVLDVHDHVHCCRKALTCCMLMLAVCSTTCLHSHSRYLWPLASKGLMLRLRILVCMQPYALLLLCVPSSSFGLQALLNSSHMYYEADKHFKQYGVTVGSLSYDWNQMQKQKNDAVEGLTKGIEGLLKKNKVQPASSMQCHSNRTNSLCRIQCAELWSCGPQHCKPHRTFATAATVLR